MIPFYVIIEDFNSKKFIKYDIMGYLINCYNESKNKPQTFEEFKQFVEGKSMYQYWSRCEYEIILCDWPCESFKKKIDVHWQIMMNHDLITNLLMYNVKV